MSKNFELLRKVHKDPEVLEPLDVSTPGLPVRYEAQSRRGVAMANEVSDWSRALQALEKNWKISAAVAIAILAVVTLVTFLTRPVYEPQASLEVDPPGTELFKLEANASSDDDSEYLETQVKALQSDQLGVEIIRRLNLASNADFVGQKYRTPPEPQTAEDGLSLTPAEQDALRVFRSRLKVRREPSSRLITESFEAHDPRLAATVTNAVLSTFIERSTDMRHKAIMESTEWLTRQLDDIKGRMDASNHELAEFQKSSGIVTDNFSSFTEQMVELNRQLTQAQADRIQLEAYLDKVKSGPETLPQISADPVTQNIAQELARARADYAQTLGLYGKNHPNAKRLQAQVDELQSELDKQRKNIMGDLRTTYAAAKARESLMSGEMQGATRKMSLISQYNVLKKEADANSELYNSLYSKVKEAGIAAGSKSSNLRLVDQARVLDRPTRPNRALNLLAGLFAAILAGVVVAFIRESFDTTIRTPDDIRRAIGYSAVSVVPVIGAGESRGLLRRSGVASQRFLVERPGSPEAEAIRGLQSSVRLSGLGRPPQVLLIVSPYPGEGKTTTAANLAIALAQHGSTVLLDADLRKAGVAQIFQVPNTKGLAELLAGSASLEEVLQPSPDVPSLQLVTAGEAVPDPGQLIMSSAMSGVLASLRSSFDHIVIDSSPILPFAECRAISHMVDGVVLVGRSGFTTREAMSRSIELLQNVNSAPVIEIVLNGADAAMSGLRYYRYGPQRAAGAS